MFFLVVFGSVVAALFQGQLSQGPVPSPVPDIIDHLMDLLVDSLDDCLVAEEDGLGSWLFGAALLLLFSLGILSCFVVFKVFRRCQKNEKTPGSEVEEPLKVIAMDLILEKEAPCEDISVPKETSPEMTLDLVSVVASPAEVQDAHEDEEIVVEGPIQQIFKRRPRKNKYLLKLNKNASKFMSDELIQELQAKLGVYIPNSRDLVYVKGSKEDADEIHKEISSELRRIQKRAKTPASEVDVG